MATDNRIPLADLRQHVLLKTKAQQAGFISPRNAASNFVRHPSGNPITGPTLAAVTPHIEAIGGEQAVIVRGWFATLPLYSVLEMLTNDSQPLMGTNREQIHNIVEAATGLDYRVEHKMVVHQEVTGKQGE